MKACGSLYANSNVKIIGGFRQCTKLVSLQLSNCSELEKFYANAFESNISYVRIGQALELVEKRGKVILGIP